MNVTTATCSTSPIPPDDSTRNPVLPKNPTFRKGRAKPRTSYMHDPLKYVIDPYDHMIDKYSLQCRHCRQVLSTERSFRNHVNLHTKTVSFACNETDCEYVTFGPESIRRHRGRQHKLSNNFQTNIHKNAGSNLLKKMEQSSGIKLWPKLEFNPPVSEPDAMNQNNQNHCPQRTERPVLKGKLPKTACQTPAFQSIYNRFQQTLNSLKIDPEIFDCTNEYSGK